jgi:hypothetical protein
MEPQAENVLPPSVERVTTRLWVGLWNVVKPARTLPSDRCVRRGYVPPPAGLMIVSVGLTVGARLFTRGSTADAKTRFNAESRKTSFIGVKQVRVGAIIEEVRGLNNTGEPGQVRLVGIQAHRRNSQLRDLISEMAAPSDS